MRYRIAPSSWTPTLCIACGHDEAEWAPAGRPLAALRARSSDEVARAVRACADLDIPVVTRGAGTGLSGGANAVERCLILDLSQMSRIVEIDEENLLAVVEPGVVNDDLKAAVAKRGLWYPPIRQLTLVDDRWQCRHQRWRPVLPEVRGNPRLRPRGASRRRRPGPWSDRPSSSDAAQQRESRDMIV